MTLSAAARRSIVTAKYLYVATLGCLAGVLNVAAMLATMRPILAPLLARTGEQLEFTVSPWRLPVVLLGAVLLAGFVAAGMMIFAVFARTFKEGQAMITPFYMLAVPARALPAGPGGGARLRRWRCCRWSTSRS